MLTLGNPIIGPLHPFGWVRPAGNTDMVVTQTAAQHAARIDPATGLHRPMALDIGDGNPDLDAILAPHAAVVAQALTVGSANLATDFIDEGTKWRIVLAHNTLPHPVVVGQSVVEGQQVGRMGSTSSPDMPVALHLHIQLGWWNGTAYVWVDPWLYLRQNQEQDMVPIPPGKFAPLTNKQSKVVLAGGATLRADRFNNAKALQLYAAGTAFTPLAQADDGDPSPNSTRWYGGMAGTTAGVVFGWLQEAALAPLVDVGPPADCSKEVKAATDPLNLKIANAQKALA